MGEECACPIRPAWLDGRHEQRGTSRKDAGDDNEPEGRNLVHKEASGEVESDSDDDAWQNANCGLEGREMLDFLEAMVTVSSQSLLSQREQTYKRLAKSSSEVKTPKDKAMVAQMLANAEFSQNELGMRAGWPDVC